MIEPFGDLAFKVKALDRGVSKGKGNGHHEARSQAPKSGENKSVGDAVEMS